MRYKSTKIGSHEGHKGHEDQGHKSGRRVGLRSRPTAREVRHPEQAGWIVGATLFVIFVA